MRATTAKWIFFVIICLLFTTVAIAQDMAAINPKSPESKPESTAPVAKYTGYWIILSGGEYYLVREGNLPPGLVTKNSENKVENIDLEGLKQAVNFRRETHINGKQVDQNYFVIKDEGGSKDIGTLNPEKNKVGNLVEYANPVKSLTESKVSGPRSETETKGAYQLFSCGAADYWCQAISNCWQPGSYPYWTIINTCVQGVNNSFCVAYLQHRGLYYYVYCNTN